MRAQVLQLVRVAPAVSEGPLAEPLAPPPGNPAGNRPDKCVLRLVRGVSKVGRIVLFASDGVRHIVIGSSSSCDWRIAARAVRARHFRLTWVRGRLRIEDQCEHGSVRVGGRFAGARLELPCTARIDFGEASIEVRVTARRLAGGVLLRTSDSAAPRQRTVTVASTMGGAFDYLFIFPEVTRCGRWIPASATTGSPRI